MHMYFPQSQSAFKARTTLDDKKLELSYCLPITESG